MTCPDPESGMWVCSIHQNPTLDSFNLVCAPTLHLKDRDGTGHSKSPSYNLFKTNLCSDYWDPVREELGEPVPRLWKT